MAGLALSAEQWIDAPPAAVFALFGAGSGAGWVFDAVCDRIAPGVTVTMRAPLGGAGAEPVEILGRISRVRRASRIEIRLDMPWRGRLRVLFDPAPRAGGCRTLALALDEPTRERIGDTAAAGMWGVAGYFEQLPDAVNAEFLRRYRRRFGAFAPPVSSISESAYEALHLSAAAARRAGEDEPRAVARELRRSRSDFPSGTVTVTGPETVSQDLFLAEATPGGLAVSRPG